MEGDLGVATPRKRVRTGCLNCRVRRRKCDEQKPTCLNCKKKNLSCRYGVKVSFIESKFQQHQAINPRTGPASLNASNTNQDVRSHQSYPTPTDLFHLENGHSFAQSQSQLPIDDDDYAATQPLLSTSGISHYRQSPKFTSRILPENTDLRDRTTTPLTSIKREQYEIGLLTYYRYYVAPVLDLGVGNLFFGIRTVSDATRSEAVYNAILALSSSRRALLYTGMRVVDEATSTSCVHFANQAIEDTQHHESRTTHLLLMCRALFSASIDSWPSFNPEINQMAQYACDEPDSWMLLVRLHLATILAPGGSGAAEPLPPLNHMMEISCEPVKQLCQALQILEQTLPYLGRETHLPHMASSSAWQSHWQDVQSWYTSRSEDIRQVFELSDADMSDIGVEDQLAFPCVIFTSACAVVANVAHHLAALILLKHKPRLAKANADHTSSISALWHIQLILGIVISAVDADVWDCFLVSALVYTGQSLSHHEQVRAVDSVLRRLSTMSGLHLASALRFVQT